MAFYIPEHQHQARIMGIDPGLNNTGVALIDINSYTGNILSVQAFTLVNDALPDYTGLEPNWVGERVWKLHKLRTHLSMLFHNEQPKAVGCESPFYNRFMPMAYGALLQVTSMIHNSVIETRPHTYFEMLEPLLVKKTVGSGATKGKLDMKLCLSQIPAIMSVLQNPLESLDEHSVDAIAVGYTLLTRRLYSTNV